MKPEWKNAPDWAMYRAMDEDENWCWYEKKPVKSFTYFVPQQGTKWELSAPDWENSLEKRPEGI